MTSTNSTSYTAEIIARDISIDIIIIAIIIISIMFDIFSLSIIIASKSKLIKTEYFILIAICQISMVNKFTGIFQKLQELFHSLAQLGLLNCLIVYTINIDVNFVFYMIIFYYSLFHLSSIKRGPHFTKFFNLIHEPKNFLIYLTFIFISYSTFIISFTFIFRSQIFLEQNGCDLNYNNKLAYIPFFFYIMAFLTQIVYLAAIVILIILKVKTKQMNEIKKLGRNLIIVIKFSIFSIISLIITMPWYIFNILYFLISYSDLYVISISQFFAQILFLFQTILLVFIHCRLREKFFSVFRKILFKFSAICK